MKALSPLLLLILIPALVFAQGEYDDLYYTPSDREEAISNTSDLTSVRQILNKDQNQYSSSDMNDYQLTTPSINSDRIYNTSQGRTVNPEYVAQYRSRADARAQDEVQNDVYYDENYQETAQFHDEGSYNQPVVNNYYYGSSWADPFYDPFYVNNWRWRYNDWRWRRASMYYDPFWSYSPGWSVNISFGSFGWGGSAWYGHRWSRWSYDPWYSPYYGGHYSSFWGPSYAPVYYTNVYYNNIEHNHSVRRGPAASRGSVVTSRSRDRSSVADSGPVTRVPVRRSSLTGDRTSRVGSTSASTSGRVIDRSGINTRSPRDYSAVPERTRSVGNSDINRGSSVPTRTRSVGTTPSRYENRSAYPSRSRTSRPSVTPSRSTDNNNRSVSPSRSGNNRNYAPSRSSGNNNRSVTPSRSSGNNNRSVTPSRSNNRSSSPSYRSSSPSRSSGSYSPSRSSSSSSSSRSSGTTRSSSSRRGGN